MPPLEKNHHLGEDAGMHHVDFRENVFLPGNMMAFFMRRET